MHGRQGEYVQFVGGLTAQDAHGVGRTPPTTADANFPGMTRVENPIESTDNERAAYEQGQGGPGQVPEHQGIPGLGRQRRPRHRPGRAGSRTRGQGVRDGHVDPVGRGQYLADGSIDKIFFWDPALAGEAQLRSRMILAEGGTIEEGTDLGVPGYSSLEEARRLRQRLRRGRLGGRRRRDGRQVRLLSQPSSRRARTLSDARPDTSNWKGIPMTCHDRSHAPSRCSRHGIVKSYGGVHRPDDVSIELIPGEVHCLAGENGCGKSTLIKIISGAERPTPARSSSTASRTHINATRRSRAASRSSTRTSRCSPTSRSAENIALDR